MGATCFFIDEDTCATNFMIRDAKMMKLVAKEKEPITPFVQKVRALRDERDVSTVLVVGGSGDYFDVADRVVLLDRYACADVTNEAVRIAREDPTIAVDSYPFGDLLSRRLVPGYLGAGGKVVARSSKVVQWGETDLDLVGLEQIVSLGQTEAVARWLEKMASDKRGGSRSLKEAILEIERQVNERGLDVLEPGGYHGGMAMPRRFEVAGAINRLRKESAIVQSND
uniref:Uncharacterized protein n=2 Tax=Corethron hystrix TaxID=216773 RepID=A0A6U5DUL4_9STRA|mmetsp:Transcript_14219/g.31099  ORF Transcript_14219/g.31099 Transcript_14219/m.31099 type:complete len:226 (+) Transcript_14219:835-1512(+)